MAKFQATNEKTLVCKLFNKEKIKLTDEFYEKNESDLENLYNENIIAVKDNNLILLDNAKKYLENIARELILHGMLSNCGHVIENTTNLNKWYNCFLGKTEDMKTVIECIMYYWCDGYEFSYLFPRGETRRLNASWNGDPGDLKSFEGECKQYHYKPKKSASLNNKIHKLII